MGFFSSDKKSGHGVASASDSSTGKSSRGPGSDVFGPSAMVANTPDYQEHHKRELKKRAAERRMREEMVLLANAKLKLEVELLEKQSAKLDLEISVLRDQARREAFENNPVVMPDGPFSKKWEDGATGKVIKKATPENEGGDGI